MKKLLAILLILAMVMSMAVVVSAGEVTITQHIPVTKENHVVSGGYSGYTHRNDSTKMNYDAENKTLSIESDDVDLVGFKVPESDYSLISDGNAVTVRITGYSDCDFRVWLSASDGDANSNIVKASELGFTAGNDFDLSFDLTALDGKSNDCIAIKAASWGANLNGLTIKTISYSYEETTVTPKFDCAVIFDNSTKTDVDNDNVYIYIEASPVEWEESLILKVVNANGDVLVQSQRNPNRDKSFATNFGASIFAYGECTDGWLQNTWTPDANNAPSAVQLWVDGVMVDEKAITTEYDWASSIANGKTMNGNVPVIDTYTGYFSTGDETHAMIIGDAIITSNHAFDANGNCVFCGHHVDVEEEEVEVVTPVESETEEVDEDEVDVSEEDNNPTTGVALAIVPMMVAAAAVVASKRR